MAWQFDHNLPIYLQIIDVIKLKIVTQELQIDEKLPSVRDFAEIVGVNPNTIQRALSELEKEGLVYAVRTTGRYVTNDQALIAQTRRKLASKELAHFSKKMTQLGYQTTELPAVLEKYLEEEK